MRHAEVTIYSDEEVVGRIINLTEGITAFWGHAQGWASVESAHLLSKSRLDWQASLARQLRLFLQPEHTNESGALILAWATLGSLVEGTLKLFLSVWYEDYLADPMVDKSHKPISPDGMTLEVLRVFFASKVWPKETREHWASVGEPDRIVWINKIQQRRNAVHAFKNRDIGDFTEFYQELKNYLVFIRFITNTFPYPNDEMYKPREL
jgi:hypothetical protein